jgi:hypothetical protein
MRLLLALCIFLTQLLFAQKNIPLGFQLPEGVDKIRIPIEINNNLIVIPVVINNQLPLKFILDTGVRTSILTEKSYSDILGLPYTRQLSIASPGGEHLLTAYIANDVSIYIPPGITGKGHALLVLEKDYLELRNFLGAEVHGVLGYELFSRFVILVNYQDKYIDVMDPTRFKPKRKYQELTVSIEDTKPFLTTTATMAGKKKEVKLLIDTGASHSLILDPYSDSEIKVPEKNLSAVIGRALGGEITGKIGRIEGLTLGKYSVPGVIANYPDPNSYLDTLKASTVERNGSIGGEILSRFTVIFNYSRDKIYLKKNSSFKKTFQTNLCGISVKAKGARLKTFEIIEVRKNSVADEMGITVGDLVASVNGRPASEFKLNELTGEFSSKPGRKLTLELIRNGETIRKTLILREEI